MDFSKEEIEIMDEVILEHDNCMGRDEEEAKEALEEATSIKKYKWLLKNGYISNKEDIINL